MNLNITIDIEAAIAQALQPEKLQPILDKHVTEAITSAIRDATGYRSKFSETLKAQLSEAMPHGLVLDDVSKFQHILNGVMNKMVQESNSNTIQTAMEKALKSLMPEVPAVLKMSELLKAARDGFHKEEHEAFYAYLKLSEYGGGWLYLDGDENPGHSRSSYSGREDRKYSASQHIAFNKEGEVYALRMDGEDVTPASRPNVISEFDRFLMALYVGRTRLEVDMDDDDVQDAAQSQED